MNVKELKENISIRGLSIPPGAFEKSEFVEVLLPHAREETTEEEIGRQVNAARASFIGSVTDVFAQIKQDAAVCDTNYSHETIKTQENANWCNYLPTPDHKTCLQDDWKALNEKLENKEKK